jgi:ParB family chromosome partitioning protein
MEVNMNQQRRLGRGLEALLGQPLGGAPEGEGFVQPEEQQFAMQPSGETVNGITHINVYEIASSPYQPRQDFDEAEIDALAQSIRDHGIIQPIVVRPMNGRFQLIAGERRLRAAIKAGWAQVPTQVREADDRQVAELAIIENLQRKDLNALEKAASFQQYLGTYGCTQEDLAARLSLDRSTVANLIRLLELPEGVKHAVGRGSISAGHARALLPLGDEQRQLDLCDRIQSEELSVRATEQLVQETLDQSPVQTLSVVGEDGQSRPVQRRTRSRQIASLEQEFRVALGAKVQISQTAKGRGKIVIYFANHNEFDRIRGQLTQNSLPQSQAG